MIWPPHHALAVIGLAIEFVGVLMLFKWAPPQPDFQEYTGLAVEPATPLRDGRTAQEHADDARNLRRHYARMSWIALAFIAAGIFVQIVDAWIKD